VYPYDGADDASGYRSAQKPADDDTYSTGVNDTVRGADAPVGSQNADDGKYGNQDQDIFFGEFFLCQGDVEELHLTQQHDDDKEQGGSQPQLLDFNPGRFKKGKFKHDPERILCIFILIIS